MVAIRLPIWLVCGSRRRAVCRSSSMCRAFRTELLVAGLASDSAPVMLMGHLDVDPDVAPSGARGEALVGELQTNRSHPIVLVRE
jgi:hypothetical protein